MPLTMRHPQPHSQPLPLPRKLLRPRRPPPLPLPLPPVVQLRPPPLPLLPKPPPPLRLLQL